MWRIGGLRSRGGAVSARSRAHDGVHIARRFHATSTATLKSLNRVCHCCFSLLDRSLNLQSEPAVIVRHRIVKPRLDDELAAVEDARHRHRFLHRRPHAWRRIPAPFSDGMTGRTSDLCRRTPISIHGCTRRSARARNLWRSRRTA